MEPLVEGGAALLSTLGLWCCVLGNLDTHDGIDKLGTVQAHQVGPQLPKPGDKGVEGCVGSDGPHPLNCRHPPNGHLMRILLSLNYAVLLHQITSALEVRNNKISATAGVSLSLPNNDRKSSYSATIQNLRRMTNQDTHDSLQDRVVPLSDTIILQAQGCKPQCGQSDAVP